MANYTMTLDELVSNYYITKLRKPYQQFKEDIRNENTDIKQAIKISLHLEKYPIFDDSYRDNLNMKIFNTYRFREHGFETVGQFTHYLHTKMCDIMVLANQLYLSELLEYDPLLNYDMTENIDTERNTDDDTIKDTTATIDESASTDVSNSGSSNEAVKGSTINSDLPGDLLSYSDIIGNFHASSSTVNDVVNNSTQNSTSKTGEKNQSQISNLDNVTRKELQKFKHELRRYGNIGVVSTQQLLMQFRETFLNIDGQVIKQLKPMFMSLYY